MEEELNGAEFWLPPQFLTDDLFLEKGGGGDGDGTGEGEGDGAGGGGGGGGGGCDPCFPMEFPCGWGYGSDLNSPVDSPTGTESSDEDDDMAGLTQQMSQHSLQGDEKGSPSSLALVGNSKMLSQAISMVGSPQSTLSELGTWNSSSRGSSNGSSLVSSPLSSPLEQHKDDAWNTLDAAARQVAQKGENEEADREQPEHGGCGILGSPARKPSSPMATTCYFASPVLTQQQQQLQVNQSQLKQKQQQGGGAWGRPKRPKGGIGPGGSRPARPLGLPAAAWPPLQQQQPQQQQPGSGMRAVFLSPASKRESGGTGVFLPRTAGNPTDFRKKPSCSTVLLPARVVHALNLDLNEIGAHRRFPGGFVLDRNAMAARSNAALPKKRAQRPQAATPASRPHREASCLPPEWTY